MERRDKCRYCGQVNHGRGCHYGPEHLHVEEGDSAHCIYCGSTDYGHGCAYSRILGYKDVHRHGHGEAKCVWCGKIRGVDKCFYSPSGKHEF